MKKLFISADFEGTAGVAHWDETEQGKFLYDHFAKQMSNAFKKLFPVGSEAVGNKTGIKTECEDFTLFADDGQNAGAIKLVAGCGNGVHIGVEGCAAA